MKNYLVILITTLTLAACVVNTNNGIIPPEFRKPPSDGKNYTVGCGDVLLISAWKEEALTRQTIVLPDGNIIFPLIGEINAVGKTIAELKRNIENRISFFMPNPNITVQVVQPNSMVVYVLGKVNAPGPYSFSGNMTVMQALTMSKGLNPYADKEKINIFRNINGTDKIFQFNYNDVSKGKNLSQNVLLERGDLIVVQ